MSSKIFEELLNNHIEIFVKAFKNLSRDLFTKTDELYHSGEFGMYRELVAKDFLKFISPKNLEFGTGFLINAFGERSNQIFLKGLLEPPFYIRKCQNICFQLHLESIKTKNEYNKTYPPAFAPLRPIGWLVVNKH